MKLVQGLVVLGLTASLLGGCGSDSTSTAGSGGGTGSAGAGSGSVDPKDCEAVGAIQKKLIADLGCSDNSAAIVSGCKLIYANNFCKTEWEVLMNCITPKPSSDFECDTANKVATKTGLCTAERAAFDGCTKQ